VIEVADYTKLQQVRQWTNDNHVDVTYVSDFHTISYLTGFGSDPIERTLALFIFADAEPFLFAPALEVEAIKGTGWPYPVYGYLDHEDPYALIATHIHDQLTDPKVWALEEGNLTLDRFQAIKAQFPAAHFDKNLSPMIQQLRLVKTPDELEKLNMAGKWADFAFEQGFAAVKAGRTEQQIAAELQYALMQKGIMEMSFGTLVQAGTHAAEPHGATNDTQVKPNELVLFDLGVMYEGYASDASRTIAYGQPTAKQKEIFDVCLEAQLTAQAAVKPGMPAEDVDKIARDIITKAGYGDYFIHRLGHGLGQTDHEFPSIMAGNHMPLVEGMCFSIEPGIYIPGVAGVRIEDCGVVTKEGFKPFTHTSKEMKILDL